MNPEVIDRTIRHLFEERAERGEARGADVVLASARRRSQLPLPSPAVDPRRRSAWKIVLSAAAAAAAVIAVGGVVNAIDAPADDVELTTELDAAAGGDPGAHGGPNAADPGAAFTVEDDQLVPLVVLDRPSFRVTGGNQTPVVFEDGYNVSGEMWTYRDPDVGLGEPFLTLRSVTEQWYLDEGEVAAVGGTEARFLAQGLVAGVQWPIEKSEWTLIGVGFDRETLLTVAESVTVAQNGHPVVADLPDRFEMTGHLVPDPSTERVVAEFSYEFDGGTGDILIRSARPFDVHSELIDRLSEAIAIESVAVAGVPGVAIDDESYRRVIWQAGGFMFELRSDVAFDELIELAGSVRPAGAGEWERVVPADWIGGSEKDGEIAAILADVPLPPRFDVSMAASATGGGERYQVIAEATGAVTCAWIDLWVVGREAGDEVAVGQAKSALSTARDWDALVEIADEGGWSSVLWQYADAVNADGTVVGGIVLTVEESYQDALGCDAR